jgi:hypothetical protein
MVEIVAFTGTFTDSGKNGVTSVSLGNVVDQLHDKYGLADAGTTEETNLASLDIGGQEIDDLDTEIILKVNVETFHEVKNQIYTP